ncbi:hypothetical protein [Fictibacillus fluitans]|uniref:DUF4083 domain-containing protein n=1 Tax=Fictibacillus fluitans TaxID=3058422 RepID=A0ABT8I2G1_9BACL|nr:hypothetical protein [Fictibacillus sp. NE201]MDN4526895.1 hypothetical protein [Fictibacillus sp. NE201]
MDNIQPNGPLDAIGALMGIFSLLSFIVMIFIIVLTIIFLFKAMGFMKRKLEADRLRNEKLERLIELQSNEINRYQTEEERT